jgi:hypothetical protein
MAAMLTRSPGGRAGDVYKGGRSRGAASSSPDEKQMNADAQKSLLRSSAFICGFKPDRALPLAAVATRLALLAADLAAAPWLGHVRISFRLRP